MNSENLVITSLKKLTKEKLNSLGTKNILLIENDVSDINYLMKFKDKKIKILFHSVYNTEQLDNYWINPVENQHIILCKNLTYYLYIREPEITFSTISYIKEFISIFLHNKKDSILSFSKNSINQYLFRNIENFTMETIFNDIRYFEEQSILTSRLGIFIYKICTFYINASEKEIGTYYSKIFGKSKVYNNKRYEIANIKGYKIPVIKISEEMNIINKIVDKLKEKNVDEEIISYATEINLDSAW
ncbi:MAG: hypothetical protein PHV52_04700 [Aliarcobacter sp.]|nr:hypothetical protein [Aliarcobacter sp.]